MSGNLPYRWFISCLAVFVAVLALDVATIDDLGLTWDEPTYRYCEQKAETWAARLLQARSRDEAARLLDVKVLHEAWPFARHGLNVHPPLAAAANMASHAALGGWVGDTVSRRLATAAEFALCAAILFGFLSSRAGYGVGLVAAGALVVMPRAFGDAHIATHDTAVMLATAATAVAFWKGIHDPNARIWRVATGVFFGAALLTKMSAALVIVPVACWMIATRLPGIRKRFDRHSWIDFAWTVGLMLIPLGVAYGEVLRIEGLLPAPSRTNLIGRHPSSPLPGWVLALPLVVWTGRRVMARWKPRSATWGAERPALETVAALLAFAPVVFWLGNPGWWHDTIARLAHFHSITFHRGEVMEEIRVLYFGRTYLYRAPWPNGFVLLAITVPASILAASTVGLGRALAPAKRDPLPLYFLLHALVWPASRMGNTPAHDGVRLILPCLFFLAGLAGWGGVAVGEILSRFGKIRRDVACTLAALATLGPAAVELMRVHPYELSYYNMLIGGPRGAWHAGMELSYWYEAFTPGFLREVDRKLPEGATVDFLYETPLPIMVMTDLQEFGRLRRDLRLEYRNEGEFAYRASEPGAPPRAFPHVWLLTQDSKASAFSRLLFVMRPWLANRPSQLGGLRVATVAEPEAVSRAWALWVLASAPAVAERPPGKISGATLAPLPRVYEPIFRWAAERPDSLRLAARRLVEAGDEPDADVSELRAAIGRLYAGRAADTLLRARPRALLEAVEILIRRPDAVRSVLLREPYTDPETIGGYLDAGLTSAASPPRPRGRPTRTGAGRTGSASGRR